MEEILDGFEHDQCFQVMEALANASSAKGIYSMSFEAKYPIFKYHLIFNYLLLQLPGVPEKYMKLDKDAQSNLYELVSKLQKNVHESGMKTNEGNDFIIIDGGGNIGIIYEFLTQIIENYETVKKIFQLSDIAKLLEELSENLHNTCREFEEDIKSRFISGEDQFDGIIISSYIHMFRFLVKHFPFFHDKAMFTARKVGSDVPFIESLFFLSHMKIPQRLNFQTFDCLKFQTPVVSFSRNDDFQTPASADLKLVDGASLCALYHPDVSLEGDKTFNGHLVYKGFYIIMKDIPLVIHCKKLFVNHEVYFMFEREFIQYYVNSRYSDTLVDPGQLRYQIESINYYCRPDSIESRLAQEEGEVGAYFLNDAVTGEEEKHNALDEMRLYINEYGECLTYIVLFFFDSMPPVNIMRSRFDGLVYVMVNGCHSTWNSSKERFHSIDEIRIFSKEVEPKLRTMQINNFGIGFQSLLIISYLFQTGDFKSEDILIFQTDDELKFKVVANSIWMSPIQMDPQHLLAFLREYNEDDEARDVFDVYQMLLYADHHKESFDETNGSALKRLMMSTEGTNRLPLITIKSLKKLFESIITKNIGLLYPKENPEEQMMKEYTEKSSSVPLSLFILAKVYEEAKNTFVSNSDLIEIYEKHKKAHDILANESQDRLRTLFEAILQSLDDESKNLMFIRPNVII